MEIIIFKEPQKNDGVFENREKIAKSQVINA